MTDKRLKAEAYEGFEILTSKARMTAKMLAATLLAAMAFHIFLIMFFAYKNIPAYQRHIMTTWLIAVMVADISADTAINYRFPDGSIKIMSAMQIKQSPAINRIAGDGYKNLLNLSLVTAFAYLIIPLSLWVMKRRSERHSEKGHLRGATMITEEQLKKRYAKHKVKQGLTIGSVAMPLDAENKHLFMFGRPGVGKTVAISQMIEQMRARGERAIFYDFKGDYLTRFYDPERGDLVFCPLDVRAVSWNIFDEIETYVDVDAIAESLVPQSISTSEPYWPNAARDVLTGIIHYLRSHGPKTNQAVWDLMTSPHDEIADKIERVQGGKRGSRHLKGVKAEQAASVLSTLMQYAKCFELMLYEKTQQPFKVGDWIENGTGFIFVINYADVKDTLRPVLTLFVDLMARRLLAQPDQQEIKTFFILDEFGTLQRMPTIIDLLTLSRSKGGACFLAIQDIGQLDKIYGKDHRQSLINACGSHLIFSVADPETARFCSQKIGEHEYLEGQRSYQMGSVNIRDSTTLSLQKKRDYLVMPAEIMELKSLTAYARFPDYPNCQTKFTYKNYPVNHPAISLKPEILNL